MRRHLEEALSRNEAASSRSQDKFEGKIDKVQEEMESVRACAVCFNSADTKNFAVLPVHITLAHILTYFWQSPVSRTH